MPLRLKCKHCAKELLLEEAFRGAGCRCQYCRHYMRVPAGASAAATFTMDRPVRPPLATETVSRAAKPSHTVSRAAKAAPAPTRWYRVVHSRSAALAVVLLAVCSVSVSAWSLRGRTPRPPNTPLIAATSSREDVTAEDEPANDAVALASNDVRRTYFGVPVEGNVVAYIVDADQAVSPYIQQLSYITNMTKESNKSAARRQGIVRPELRQRFSIVGIAERERALDGSEAALSPQLPAEGIDFPQAFTTAANWYADQIFLVVARPIASSEIDGLAQNAEQTGAVTHVIALGQAANQDLSAISNATGGRFIQLSNDQFNDWANRYKNASSN